MSKVSIINEKNLGVIDEEFEYESIDELAALISTTSYAPGLFNEGRRLISNLKQIELLILDVDDGASLEEAKQIFRDHKHIIATSRSHQKEKNGKVCDRFRVVLFLTEPIDSDRVFKMTWAKAYAQWPFIDKACKDSARFFYPSPQIISINRAGLTIDPMREPTVEIPTKSESLELDDHLSSGGNVADKPKGELWKSTLKFLLEGAPSGKRHNALVNAVGNMREQGYSKPEVIEALERMIELGGDWTSTVTNTDLKTIDRMFAREMKYEYKPPTEGAETPIVVNASELIDEAFEYLSDKDKVKGEPTGIEGLDRLLGGGFRTGELTVLMAQAKTGKNTLYHYLIYKHLERGIPFGYASRELNPATEVVPNLLSIALGLNTWTAEITPDLKARAQAVVSNWSLYFAPGYGHFDVKDMERWFRTLKETGVNHFLFDHFHYALHGEDYEATATLIKKLKSLTKELDIHLSLIVQPRSLREGEALSLATLRGGAAIGQALDNLLILERVKNENNISKLTLEVARHKLAKLGHIHLMYDNVTTSFVEVEKTTVVDEDSMPTPKGIERRGFNGRSFPRVN